MRVGWTHSTLARLSLLTADRTLGAIDTPIAPIFCIADPGFFIGRIAAGGLIVAEVLGRPGYRENAVRSARFCTRPGHTQEFIDIRIGHDKQRLESYLRRHDLGPSGRCPG